MKETLVTIVVRTEGLSKHYDHTVALDGLDLEIEAGEVLGYLGPNGAGKSTTIGLLLGLIRPSSGSARIFDLDAWRDAPSIHRRLAYVPSLTGAEVLRFLSAIHGSVDAAYLDELVDRFELTVDKKIRAYSHGNRQKVLLIAAFASRADLVLLDEPTTGLDPLMEQVFRACVIEARDRGQTVLLSSRRSATEWPCSAPAGSWRSGSSTCSVVSPRCGCTRSSSARPPTWSAFRESTTSSSTTAPWNAM